MVVSFENQQILERMAVKYGVMALSDRHYKDGEKSLRWDFVKGSELMLHMPVGYRPAAQDGKDSRVPTFGVYLYAEKPVGGHITVLFMEQDTVCAQFTLDADFTGWRSIFVKFDIDMQGTPTLDMNRIVFRADDADGTLYIDQLVPCNMVDPRSPVASFQVPFVQRGLDGSAGRNEYTFYDAYRQIPEKEGGTSDVVEAVKEQYLFYLLHHYADFQKTTAELTEYVRGLGLRFEDGQCTGHPIEYVNQREIIDGLEYNYQPVKLREYSEMLFSVAYTYLKTKDEKLPDLFLSMLRHLLDQGLQAGSSMGVLHHIDYSLRMFYPAVFLMEQEIATAGLLEQVSDAICWFSKFGTIFVRELGRDNITSDTFNTQSQAYLIAALMANSQSYLRSLKEWLDFAMRPTEGLMGLFKEDGSVYHHCGHYTAYGMDGLTGVMPVVYALSGTKFQLSDDAWYLLSKVLFNMRFYVNKYDYSLAMSGRHPNGTWRLNLVPFRYWALAGLARKDSRPAAVYLRLLEGIYPKKEDMVLLNSGVKAEPEPQGQLTMNRACAAFHRTGDTLISVKGFSKYLWGNETYRADNLYGRYMSYGQLEIIRGSLKESGFSQEGWDWARLPGTTAIHYPIDEMRAKVYNLDAYSGFEEMLISDQPFAGGVDDGQNGMFAFALHGHPKYDGTHRALLSYYFMDDFVLCLGSGITNEETRCPTNTTLFQKVCTGKPPVFVNGKIEDGYGNIFYTDAEVQVQYGVQHSQAENGSGATEGQFAVAYIDHGCAPQDAHFVYGIGINGAKKPDYEVLQMDETAHAVRIGDTLFCAVFRPESFTGCGPISEVSDMALLMYNGKKLMICQPDLGLYDSDPSQYDQAGNRREVSIYSRNWLYHPVRAYHLRVVLNGIGHTFYIKGGEVSGIELE